MTIAEHADEFAGLPVRDYDPKAGIENPTTSVPRLSTNWDSEESFNDLLAQFLEDPNASQLVALVIGAWQGEDSQAGSESIIEALVAARETLSNLRALFFGDIISEENEISWIQQSDVTPLFDAFPKLEIFRVRGGSGLVIGQLRHENLRSLIVETGGLDAEVIRGLAGSDLPRLEHLELWLGEEGYGRTVTVDDLAPILKGDRFPALRHLGLRNARNADEVAQAVAESPLLSRVEVLDISLGDLGDEGALALAASPATARLKELDFHHHYVSDDAIQKLEALKIKVNSSERQEPYDWGGELHRYIAVSE